MKMKILWTTNSLVGDAGELLLNKKIKSGGWMTPFLEGLKEQSNIELVIVTSSDTKKVLFAKKDNVSYYILPGGHPIAKYEAGKKRNIEIWKDCLAREKPDVIHIWGIESSIGRAALTACDCKIPAIIYMQGVADALDRYCEAGISRYDQKRMATLRDYLRFDTIWLQHKKYQKMIENERWLIRNAKNVIVENRWCYMHCKNSYNDVNAYYLPLSINKVFFEVKRENFDKYTITCPLSYAPLKGLHVLYKALAIVKEKYPQVKLKMPGNKKIVKGLKDRLLQDGYSKYLDELARIGNIQDNIEYMGILSAEEMAQNMSKAHVFVMCSSIENHSSTLKEAMAVGLPCITSDVGGVMEYVDHKQSGLIYRFEEYELLAQYIIDCFENDDLCNKLALNARQQQLRMSQAQNTILPIIDIYRDLLGREENDGSEK